MTKLRKGDIVNIQGTVTEVVEDDNVGVQISSVTGNQQVRVRPQELQVEFSVLEVGDRVRWMSSGEASDGKDYEVVHLEKTQAVVREVGTWPIHVVAIDHLRRL